jgi:hypothetical protein
MMETHSECYRAGLDGKLILKQSSRERGFVIRDELLLERPTAGFCCTHHRHAVLTTTKQGNCLKPKYFLAVHKHTVLTATAKTKRKLFNT